MGQGISNSVSYPTSDIPHPIFTLPPPLSPPNIHNLPPIFTLPALSCRLLGIFYTLCQFHNPLEVEVSSIGGHSGLALLSLSLSLMQFLDVYHPSEEEKDDPELYARNVQLLVSK